MISKHCLLNSSLNESLKLGIFDSIQLVNAQDWNSVVGTKNIYLSLSYLSALEGSLSEDIDFKYILFYDKTLCPVGVAVVQLHTLTAREIDYHSFAGQIGDIIPEKVLNKMETRVMLCGNAFSTGENGFLFCETLDTKVAIDNLLLALQRVKREEKKSSNQVSLVLLKDFWPESFGRLKALESDKFRSIDIDVNMILKMQESWLTWDDYLCDLITKYRTKAKSVFKKSDTIQSVDFSAKDIARYQKEMNALYLEVLNKAKFRFGTLNANTFQLLKESFEDAFKCIGYFHKNTLVGFSTCFIDNAVLDANFVGINYNLNHEFSLYQRMLCDFVKLGIEFKVKEIRFGRTAEEIKSCLGAEPVEMKIMIKHRNHITNTLMKPLLSSIKPSPFDLRKPFKALVYETWIP